MADYMHPHAHLVVELEAGLQHFRFLIQSQNCCLHNFLQGRNHKNPLHRSQSPQKSRGTICISYVKVFHHYRWKTHANHNTKSLTQPFSDL